MVEGFVTVFISLFITILSIVIYRHHSKKELTVYLPRNVLMTADAFPSCVKSLQKMINNHFNQVLLDFSRVNKIDYESYLVILAQSEKVFYKGKNLRPCNIHQNKQVGNVIFKNNKNRKVYHQSNPFPPLNSEYYLKNDQITPEITFRIENELKKIDIKNYYEFNTMVSELVGNAIEHGIRHRNINWWMFHDKDYKTRTVKFVFVDMGIGIIDSYKKSGLPQQYAQMQDDEILMLALKGVLGSSTKERNRGRGLPQIRDMVEKTFISNFVLITNTVSLRYNNGKFEKTKHQNFVGTYYSWTINKENFISWRDRI